eukprot:TRINITY_DN1475_c0_g1_i2.p1 TRINITY_DN1475_c0_g1~~TRINITY_DN1475_c0_g1_i2.p1  ORF type:complete len:382 (+),score=38.03 TRINITY_DN1475_c0_g1_i2:1198-2343(+)
MIAATRSVASHRVLAQLLLLACALQRSVAVLTLSSSSRAASGAPRARVPTVDKPTLHLLILLGDKLPFSSIWKTFFAGANTEKFRVWVHCSAGRDACMQANDLSVLPNLEVIETAPSSRCADLLSPEVRLLERALAWQPERPAASNDKFALVSDSTLPVKPLDTIYDSLLAAEQSHMCFFPLQQWATRNVDGSSLAIPKIHQWAVFNRQHAATLTQNWEVVNRSSEWQWRFPMHGQMIETAGWQNPPREGHWCADELAVFSNIHGALDMRLGEHRNFSKYNIDDTCLTFLMFGWHNAGNPGPASVDVLEAVKADPNIDFGSAVDPDDDWDRKRRGHPVTFHGMGNMTMHALRASPYFFMRKFSYDARLHGYAEIMFGASSS